MKEEEKRILSIEDVLHLQSDKHTKKDDVMPEVDTSRYVLNQRQKTETVRKFTSTANITEEERRQFNQGSSAPNRNVELAKQFRQAKEVAESHFEEEAKKNAKAVAEKTATTAKNTKELTQEIKAGDFEFSFGAFIEGSENLKGTI